MRTMFVSSSYRRRTPSASSHDLVKDTRGDRYRGRARKTIVYSYSYDPPEKSRSPAGLAILSDSQRFAAILFENNGTGGTDSRRGGTVSRLIAPPILPARRSHLRRGDNLCSGISGRKPGRLVSGTENFPAIPKIRRSDRTRIRYSKPVIPGPIISCIVAAQLASKRDDRPGEAFDIDERWTREASHAYRAALICNRSRGRGRSRTMQRAVGTVQRALVTVTSSGTTFLTLARARPALGARSPAPFVSPSSPGPLPIALSAPRPAGAAAREVYEPCEGPSKPIARNVPRCRRFRRGTFLERVSRSANARRNRRVSWRARRPIYMINSLVTRTARARYVGQDECLDPMSPRAVHPRISRFQSTEAAGQMAALRDRFIDE